MSLPTTYPNPVLIAVIGGTGISNLTSSGFEAVAQLTVDTPWGAPSSPITILHTPDNTPIAFLSRHGLHHNLLPTEVPGRANIAALRSLGVRSIIAFSAVGSLRLEIRPRDFVVPDQVIDRTRGFRPDTFFGNGVVGHVGFADPFDAGLRSIVSAVGTKVLAATPTPLGLPDSDKPKLHAKGTVICMEGPAFSTRAESHMYRALSPDTAVINMSALPEAKLAREAELAYVMICMSTDYDCWREGEEAVTVETVMGNMRANGEMAKTLLAEVLKELAKQEHGDLVAAKHLEGASGWAVCTGVEGRAKEAWEKLVWLLPGSFKPLAESVVLN
ncbi:S-methyl-5'-thioadenosine phosphorylase [Peziza echinospora]|nr:S-methyl-5'-thioadenosine phosphorylase [Peziza echinospora]